LCCWASAVTARRPRARAGARMAANFVLMCVRPPGRSIVRERPALPGITDALDIKKGYP
jgi:hypothetical protein